MSEALILLSKSMILHGSWINMKANYSSQRKIVYKNVINETILLHRCEHILITLDMAGRVVM